MSHIVILYDASLPYEGVRPDQAAIESLSRIGKIAAAGEWEEALRSADVAIHLHGPYFPKADWPALGAFLKRGGGLLHVGGAPFRFPAHQVDGQWQLETEQTAYHQQLNIHEVLPVDPEPIFAYEASSEIPLLKGRETLFDIQPTFGFVLHFTTLDDHPGDGGTSGPMDAHLYPLLKGVSRDGREVAAPVVLVENTKASHVGGRWLFINMLANERLWSSMGIRALEEWSAYCANGVTEIWFKPNYASYYPGERPTLTLQLQQLSRLPDRINQRRRWSFEIAVSKHGDDNLIKIWSEESSLTESRELQFIRFPVDIPIEPGYYEAECRAQAEDGETKVFRQGFWGFDEKLLQEGEFLSRDRDYFRRGNRPMPIVGMTYMTSDVARKFLLMPNVHVWNRDMAQMSRAGINLIRTGIWSMWRQTMFVDGHASEEVMRSIDAFMLTAKKHGLEVNFTFFTFTPERWEGANPYLDPRSVEAQRRFIASIVSRHAKSTYVHWDLINEPSLFDPKNIFNGAQTAGDPYERKLYVEWLSERHGSDVRVLQERWNMSPDELPDYESVHAPTAADITFKITGIQPRRNARLLDYTLFSMDMLNKWTRELSETIHSIQPAQMVTVGQDEGICSQRPSPFFYGQAVDYTTVHTWWQNDDLMWDGIFTKTPDKPNLIQETGIMYTETPEGKAKRSETELKAILERKYAYAFASGGAGAVQWIWNINPYMDNVNESNIGAVRADGTEKPEADVSYEFGRFMSAISPLFEGRKLEEIAVVYPFSNDFSTRKLAMDATTRLTRTMLFLLKQPIRGLSEYHLDSLTDHPPRLLIVPSAHNFSGNALEKLLLHVEERGGTLLFTGPMGLDEYWRPTQRMSGRIGSTKLANIRREEALVLEDKILPVSFPKLRFAEASKELSDDLAKNGPSHVTVKRIGKGKLIHCPLPVELNERSETLVELYRFAIREAGVRSELEWLKGGEFAGIYGRKLDFAAGALYIFVSEYAIDEEVEVRDPANGRRYKFMMEAERTVMFAADREGEIIGVYRPEEVNISNGKYI
ncbi:beta-galactosidase [Cohnella mopanensis]|uniref:beta-galactosidase n=1 Tax=Cohnella mopanensis TaxID=2911966 RepID=UPI001EF7BC48|nr:beta-galactosidase [Cohnella mopanensis]